MMLTTLPGASFSKPGSAGLPLFGVEIDVVKDDGTSSAPNEEGKLVEETYRVGGRYDRQISRIVGHLEADQRVNVGVQPFAVLRQHDRSRRVGKRNFPDQLVRGFVEVRANAWDENGVASAKRNVSTTLRQSSVEFKL